ATSTGERHPAPGGLIMGTRLYVWVERLKTVVGGETVYALRDGVKVPLSTDELIQELDRRHEGLLFPLRFTVSNRFLAETLSTVRAESLPSVESFQQWTLEEIEMAVRAQRKG